MTIKGILTPDTCDLQNGDGFCILNLPINNNINNSDPQLYIPIKLGKEHVNFHMAVKLVYNLSVYLEGLLHSPFKQLFLWK